MKTIFKRTDASQFTTLLIGTAIVGHGLSYSKIYLFHLILLLSFVFLMTSGERSHFIYRNSRDSIFIFACVVWLSVLAVVKFNGYITLQYLAIWWLMYVTVLVVLEFLTRGKIKTIVNTLYAVTSVAVLVALVEVSSGWHWPTAFHYDRTIIDCHLYSRCQPVSPLWNRPVSLFYSQNTFALFLVCVLPFVLMINSLAVRTAAFSVAGFVAIFNDGRAAQIALVVVALLWIVRDFRRVFTLFLSVPLLIFLLSLTSNQTLLEDVRYLGESIVRLVRGGDQVYDSVSIRAGLIENALQKNLVTGSGPGSSLDTIDESGELRSLHFYWLEVVVEAGIVGLIYCLYVAYLAVWLLRESWLSNVPPQERYSESVALSLIGVSIAGLGAGTMLYFIPYWILLAMAVYLRNESKGRAAFSWRR